MKKSGQSQEISTSIIRYGNLTQMWARLIGTRKYFKQPLLLIPPPCGEGGERLLSRAGWGDARSPHPAARFRSQRPSPQGGGIRDTKAPPALLLAARARRSPLSFPQARRGAERREGAPNKPRLRGAARALRSVRLASRRSTTASFTTGSALPRPGAFRSCQVQQAPCRATVVSPGRIPAAPECEVTSLARRNRT
jgi:hypothetical protein